MSSDAGPPFHKQRHIKYFLRCLKTFLPRAYTPNDSNRMTLGFFILAGLDLLDALHTTLTPAERAGYANWIYHCQVPGTGGFRGFPGTDFGAEKGRNEGNECWDPANVPATFFALVTLLILGDDLGRVRRRECLAWLRRMQRHDGSFGDVLGENGAIEGDRDLRFCCCAVGIRYVLRGEDEGFLGDVEDIDTEKLVDYVRSCQSYDGGFAGAPAHEAHAGLTYCALSTLSFLGLTPLETSRDSQTSKSPITNCEDLIGWLAFRQTSQLYELDEDSETGSEDGSLHDPETSTEKAQPDNTSTTTSLSESISSLPTLQEASQLPADQFSCAGFNGRLNKTADTCYCFWVTGSLAMLNRLNVANPTANRNFLLGKTQHMIGGFGKCVDEPPDILHSYLGLASLGLFGESDLDEVDPAFCTSMRVRRHLESLPWWKGPGGNGN